MLICSPSPENILHSIKECKAKNGNDFIILCGEHANLDIPALIALLNQNGVRFCGGVFPRVYDGKTGHADKVILLPTYFESNPQIVEGLDSGDINIPNLELPTSGSLFIMVDGLSSYISKFIYCLYQEVGLSYEVFGSGAGQSSFSREECVFNKDGFFLDAAVFVLIKNPISQSTKHGWKPFAGPYLATKTTANVLEQINWEPAYKTYKELIEKEEGIVLTDENYYEYAKHYPFGIHRSDGENLLRDPVSLEPNGALLFGAEIPSNAVLYLMKSQTQEILGAGLEVCKAAIAKCSQPSYLFFASCISRKWILMDKFEDELKNISTAAEEKSIPIYGVLSLGEISSSNEALLDYHHKTIVVTVIESYG